MWIAQSAEWAAVRARPYAETGCHMQTVCIQPHGDFVRDFVEPVTKEPP